MASAARCTWGFFGLFLLTWLLEGLLIGEAPGPFMYVCVGTLILSATIAHLPVSYTHLVMNTRMKVSGSTGAPASSVKL